LTDLEPGDLIFFSLENNGRFMNISHVAIYAGNGYIMDASSSRGQVVYRQLFGSQVLYGRP
jgi:Cell wall-associated hydrolases (invasion-associated proteins)